MAKKPEYASAVQAAALTGLSEKTIRRKIERGELKATKQGTSYQIRIKDLDKLTGQRPPTPDILLQRIQELEQRQEQQAEQIDSQAKHIVTLEQRIQQLEQRPAPTVNRLATGYIPHKPVQLAPIQADQEDQDEGRTPTASLAAPASLPPGSILAAHVADQIGINRRTFNDQIRAGRVPVTTISKGGRSEHWLTPDQQDELRRQRGL
jgi:excisionase family DNA binding protein